MIASNIYSRVAFRMEHMELSGIPNNHIDNTLYIYSNIYI